MTVTSEIPTHDSLIVSVIWNSAFSNCYNLTSITIPSSVTSVAYTAFTSCSSLNDIYYTGTGAQWAAINNLGSNYLFNDVYNGMVNTTIHYNSPG